jgi:uncharacterized protein YjdB
MITRLTRQFSPIAVCAMLLVAGCDDSSTEPIVPGPAAEIEVGPEEVLLAAPGETAELEVTVYDEDGNLIPSPSVEWQSSDEGVVTVQDGIVTAVGEGSATVTATSGSASSSIVVDVSAPPQVPATVTVSPETLEFTELGVGQSLSATVHDGEGNEIASPEVEWASSDGAVATVDEDGVVTPVAEGSATITATSGEASGSAEVTVTLEDPTTEPSVEVSPEAITLTSIGATESLSTLVRDEEGNEVVDAEIQWSSSNESVATVDEDGVVTAVAPGSATITATSGVVSGSTEVSVELEGPALVVSPATLLLSSVGATGTLEATLYDVEGVAVVDPEVEWTSSDEAVATVDEDGVVTAVAEGSATITATSGDVAGTAAVTVEIQGTTVEIQGTTVEASGP